jgi:acyl-CoA synthetase (AMP-forming)/AMP-acid ligase II
VGTTDPHLLGILGIEVRAAHPFAENAKRWGTHRWNDVDKGPAARVGHPPGMTATAEEIQEFCQGKIAHFKVPQYIRFVESFPMTATGKVQKYKIREIEKKERGITQSA